MKENKTTWIILRVTPREKELLKKDAKANDTTISKWLRRLLNLE